MAARVPKTMWCSCGLKRGLIRGLLKQSVFAVETSVDLHKVRLDDFQKVEAEVSLLRLQRTIRKNATSFECLFSRTISSMLSFFGQRARKHSLLKKMSNVNKFS